MSIYTDLLFLGGHVADPKLARSLDDDAQRRQPVAPPVGRPPARDGCVTGPVRRGGIVSICSVALSSFR